LLLLNLSSLLETGTAEAQLGQWAAFGKHPAATVLADEPASF
jgi:hypothetical protein